MKQLKSYTMLLCLMLSIGTAIHAQTKGTRFEPKKAATAELFFDSNVSVTASIEPQEVVVPIALASEVDITAFQADLYLPQQFILAGIDTGAIVTDTHEFTTSQKDNVFIEQQQSFHVKLWHSGTTESHRSGLRTRRIRDETKEHQPRRHSYPSQQIRHLRPRRNNKG